MDWLSAVDSYLYLLGKMGVEQVLCDGCLSGRVPAAVSDCATIEPELVRKKVEDDGGTAEAYRGTLIVAGVRYSFECELFADAGGAYFVSSIGRFEPVEWSTKVQVA
jgi:hypothetical protein